MIKQTSDMGIPIRIADMDSEKLGSSLIRPHLDTSNCPIFCKTVVSTTFVHCDSWNAVTLSCLEHLSMVETIFRTVTI